MNSLDERLANRLHDIVDGEPDSTPPTGMLLDRGRRARHRRATVIVSATCAVLALGVATAVSLPAASTPARPSASAAAVSPQLELASAITASENISYRVKVAAGRKDTRGNAGSKDNRGNMWTTEGAFDPASATGYLNSSRPDGGVVYYERLIDGVRFVGSSGSKDKWKQYPGKHDRLAYDRALNGAVGASADPDLLFEALRQAGATITQTGAGTYHFEVTLKDDSAAITRYSFVGDVTLGADKRIAKVAYERTMGFEKPGQVGASTDVVTIESSMEFSDYGTAVQVDRPIDVVVVK